MKSLALIFVLLAAVALAAEPLAVTAGDDGKTLELTVGQTAALQLTMAGGTGYSWELSEVDPQILEVGERRTEVGDPTLVGGPVKLTWPLKAVGKGKATLEAKLVRPWMRHEPAKELAFHFVVGEP